MEPAPQPSEPPASPEPQVDAAPSADAPEIRPARKPTRRVAKRAAGAPEPLPASEPQPAEPGAESTDTQAAQKPPARRRTRKTAVAAAPEAPPETPTETTDQAPVAPTEAPRRSRRTRKTAPAPEPTPVLDEARPSEVGEVSTQEILDSLAQAIAGGEPSVAPSAEPVEVDATLVGDASAEAGEEVADDEESDTDAPADEAAEADSADEASDDTDEGDDEAGEQQTSSRRRRRRRGGRRRRRGGDESADDASGDADAEPEGDADAGAEADSDAEDADDATEPGRRRRRRRRRRGEEAASAEDDPSDVVVRVREPRSRRAVADEVTGIDGSTRMEAKKQRRREGRAAGRRRAPILSEAEFLARRESVERVMAIRQRDEYNQIAVLEDGVLVEHYVDRASATSLIGNIYLGRVQNVLPSMEAAFIDIGRGRNAVLYAGEVDWDAFGAEGQSRQVEKVFKSGQSVLVQVTKDPVGAKGARLTGHISIPGRYIVYSPGGHLSGISRKLPDVERQRLKDILTGLISESESVIVRTAAEGATEDELVRDVNRLKAQWEVIAKKVKGGSAPQQLYAEPDLTVRIVRDLFTEDFSKLVIHGNGGPEDAYDSVEAYVKHVAPHLEERLEQWDESRGDLFSAHRVDEQVAKALERKVFLPSGGSLIIDRTEAMTVIDVNTGKFTGHGGNLEATVTSNNLEAAEEIVRQLRLRDIGGIIVIDFIDMVLPSNRELLLRRLVECLGRDRTRHQVAEVTSLGLVQMTRKKIGTGLAEAFTEVCEHCHGRGYTRHEEPVATQGPADGGERRPRRGRGSSAGSSNGSRSRSGARSGGSPDEPPADPAPDAPTD